MRKMNGAYDAKRMPGMVIIAFYLFTCCLLPSSLVLGTDEEGANSSINLTTFYPIIVRELILPYNGPKCHNLDQCKTALRGRKVDSERERNCACDQQCALYGDCCVDSPWIGHSVIPQNRSFKCIDIPGLGGFYMIDKCPVTIENSDVQEKCERGNIESDPVASLPVTDATKRITYRNIFCAMCHNDSLNKTFWNLNLNCADLNGKRYALTEDEIRSNLVFNEKLNSWMVDLKLPNGSQIIKSCSINPVFPASVESSIRSCRSGLIESCPPTWDDHSDVYECQSYQASRFTDRTGYRNAACARCNGVNVTSLKCTPQVTRALGGVLEDINGRSSVPTTSLSILLDINMGSGGGADVGKINQCSKDQIWDIFIRSCRSVVCAFKDYRLANGRCRNVNHLIEPSDKNNFQFPDTSESSTQGIDFYQCPQIILSRTEVSFISSNESAINQSDLIYVSRYNRTFNSTNYLIEKDIIYICSDFLNYEISLNKFSPQMGLVTLIGLGISICSLVLHIIAFSLVSDVRNLSGHNLVCLSTSLIFAYSSFICMQLLVIRKSTLLCQITGATVLYFFLASMAWMNVIAWDVCRTLRMATVELRVASGKQRGRFAIYSIYAWSVSGLFTGAALLVDHLPSSLVPDTIKPGLGLSGHCWFQRRSALIIFFASPVALIMLINLFMFSFSTLMISSTTRGAKSFTQITSARTNYKLYFKLWLLMGLTWFVGFPASFLESLSLWYIFIILNTLQGLFIFIAFSCKRKILRTVKSKLSHLTSSSAGGSYSVATLSQNNSKLSDSDLTIRSPGHLHYQPNRAHFFYSNHYQSQKSHHSSHNNHNHP